MLGSSDQSCRAVGFPIPSQIHPYPSPGVWASRQRHLDLAGIGLGDTCSLEAAIICAEDMVRYARL